MTRDGTFLIEDGQISRAVRNLRYNERITDLLAPQFDETDLAAAFTLSS